jgi:hypothetical protein
MVITDVVALRSSGTCRATATDAEATKANGMHEKGRNTP